MKKSHIIAIIVVAVLIMTIVPMVITAMIAVPNVTDVQDKSQVNADIATAKRIGQGIIILSVEHAGKDVIPSVPTEYDKIFSDTEKYIEIGLKPNSLKDGEYYLVNVDGKIKVAIAKEASDVKSLADDIMYDGTGAGWAYIYKNN